jgi:hypothetical protein
MRPIHSCALLRRALATAERKYGTDRPHEPYPLGNLRCVLLEPRDGRGPSLSTSTAPDGPQGLSKVSCLSFVLVAAGRPAGAEPLWAGHRP